MGTQTHFWTSTPNPSEAGSINGEPVLGHWIMDPMDEGASICSNGLADEEGFAVDPADESYAPSVELTIDKCVKKIFIFLVLHSIST